MNVGRRCVAAAAAAAADAAAMREERSGLALSRVNYHRNSRAGGDRDAQGCEPCGLGA